MYKDKIKSLYKRKKILENMLEAQKLIREETQLAVDTSKVTYDYFYFVIRQLENHQRVYVKNSVFDVRDIGLDIADIISEFEGEGYVCQYTSVIHPKLVLNGLNINYKGTEKSKICVVVKESSECPFYKFSFVNDYSVNSIKRLTESGDMLVLGVLYENVDYRKTGRFPIRPGIASKVSAVYKEDCSHMPRLIFDVSKFPYLEEFIDMVIDYRIENNIDDIPINELKQEFLESKKDYINARLTEKLEREVKSLELKINEKI